jgi:hypothetical protein
MITIFTKAETESHKLMHPDVVYAADAVVVIDEVAGTFDVVKDPWACIEDGRPIEQLLPYITDVLAGTRPGL